jgi:CPA1 family monovalent cation:H+ antiporter
MFYALPLVNLPISYIFCLLFGALISPTDPIAVIAMIKKSKVSKNLESQIAGESLFNDGVGVVIFLTILHVATSGNVHEFEPTAALLLFLQEVFGGILLGIVIGAFGFYLLKIIPNEFTEIEVLVTLSMVLGGASVAEMLHVSGPLAMVTMGIMIGKEGRSKELADVTGEYVYKFWHLLDEAMNAILFILIGLQIIVITWKLDFFYAAGIAIVVVLFARFIGVGLPLSVIRFWRKLPKYSIRTITWSGLRGGISVALALSLYDAAQENTVDKDIVNLIIAMTYAVVLFSIIVQGLTIKKLFALMEKEDVKKQQENKEDLGSTGPVSTE